MEILKLKPAYKNYIWGGDKLKKFFNKNCEYDKVAESWELSCHNDGLSIIDKSKYGSISLSEYIKNEGKSILGKNCERFEYFPILIKLIDAEKPLSVQVHPDDNYALKNENQYGKTEMWYIIDCEKDAFLYYGFKKAITKNEFEKAINEGTLENILNKVYVKKGDIFFIKSGTIHAIGKGITIAEIQQNSNVTYRVYDYNRKDSEGNTRQLHIKQAIDVTNLDFTGKNYDYKNHVSCNIFDVDILDVCNNENTFNADENSFNSIIVVDGEGEIVSYNNKLSIKKGDSIFIPAGMGEYTIKGSMKFIKTLIP